MISSFDVTGSIVTEDLAVLPCFGTKNAPDAIASGASFNVILFAELEVGGKPYVPEASVVAKRRGKRCAGAQD